jgi:hypothetical protein
MQTPVWSSEPIPAEPLRTVDLFPAMLEWLGEPVPAGLDGDAIWLPGEHRRRQHAPEPRQQVRGSGGAFEGARR